MIDKDKFKSVTCNKCGWVHFPVTVEYVRAWQKKWAEYWPTLDEEGKESFGLPNGPPSVDSYLVCQSCSGSHKNFRDSVQGDSPEGCTIGPILARDEDLT